MRTEKVVIGGQELEIRELPLRKNAEWRQKVSEVLTQATSLMAEADEFEMKAGNMGVIQAWLVRARDLIFESPDMIVGLVGDYAPELRPLVQADVVYESELMDAFKACLKLAFPFGRMLDLLLMLVKSGSRQGQQQTTSKSSEPPAMTETNG